MPRRKGSASISTVRLLERLQAWEAQHVLRELVGARPDVAPLAEEIARALLKAVSSEQVAQDLEDSVRALDMDDLDSGPTAFCYVEPCEAAWEVLDATVQPFVEDLKRRIELGLEAEALEICKGVLLGLYRLRGEESHDVLAHAPDFLDEAAGEALAKWRHTQRRNGATNRVRPTFPSDFVGESIPAWRDMVERVLRSARG
jgi:hypothetical protein